MLMYVRNHRVHMTLLHIPVKINNNPQVANQSNQTALLLLNFRERL